MLTEVRGDPLALDARWMTGALEEAGVARGATVTELVHDGFIGTGQMGRTARFSLTWDQPEGRPVDVVGKFPADDPVARSTGFDHGSYLKEWTFYKHLKPTLGVRTPEVWVACYDEAAPDFVLIMESLGQSCPGDQMKGLTVDEAALAVEQAVAFHAPRWGDDSVETLLGKPKDQAAAELGQFYALFVEGALERLGPGLSEEARALVRTLTPLVPRWANGVTTTPSTVAHMDYRPDNLLFAAGPGAPPLAVVDWQTIAYWPGATDIAYLVGGAFEPADRAAAERALVQDYCRRLNAAGVPYDAATCWDDYRVGSIWGVVMSVIAAMLAQVTERGDEMLTTMLRRHAQHALDVGALDLLR